MTYLEAINKVLIRLREDEVTSPTATAYSKLIGEFVNDAVRLVEDSWDWNELRSVRPITTTATVSSYTISGLNENFKILGAYDATSKEELHLGTEKDYYDYVYLESSPQGKPEYYLFNSFSDQDNTLSNFRVYPTPDKAYTLIFDLVDRSPELVTGSSDIRVAADAVVQFAHAMAVEERGEVGGQQSARLYSMAQSTLNDKIAYDVARRPVEVVWRDV